MSEEINIDKLDSRQKLVFDFNKALYIESCVRESAFLPITLDICGIEVKQYTMRHHILLDFANNPFVKGGVDFDKEHILEFLWIVSTDFEFKNAIKKMEFIAKQSSNLDDDFYKYVYEINEYLSNAFLDMNQLESVGAEVETVSWIASIITTISSRFGWHDEYILDLPMARVSQYLRAIYKDDCYKNGVTPTIVNKLSDPAKKKMIQPDVDIKE